MRSFPLREEKNGQEEVRKSDGKRERECVSHYEKGKMDKRKSEKVMGKEQMQAFPITK